MDEYAVLIFRDQPLTDQQQLDFTRNFGELEGYNTPGHIRRQSESRLGAGMADFSNLDKSGNIMSDRDRVWFFKLGDRLWHSDSFVPPGARRSIRCYRGASSRPGAPTRTSPTCAPRTMRWILAPKRKSKIWSANIR